MFTPHGAGSSITHPVDTMEAQDFDLMQMARSAHPDESADHASVRAAVDEYLKSPEAWNDDDDDVEMGGGEASGSRSNRYDDVAY